jgi:uncharacterized membrane protein
VGYSEQPAITVTLKTPVPHQCENRYITLYKLYLFEMQQLNYTQKTSAIDETKEESSAAHENPITRLVRIADIIFALAMAQCFFAVDFPTKIYHPTNSQALAFLLDQIKPLTSYAIAFVIVGFYWIDNINQFKYYQKTDSVHSFLYLLYLMWMFLIPYSDTLAIYFPDSALVKIWFSVNTACIGLLSFLNWTYATHECRLVDRDLNSATIVLTRQKILIEPIFSLLTIGVAAIAPAWWEYVWFLLPIPYFWNDICKFCTKVYDAKSQR